MQREYTKDNRSKLINQFIRNSNEQKEEEKKHRHIVAMTQVDV